MAKNNSSKGFRSFVKEKGYYIVLLLCAAAVGVSGYFLLTDKTEEPSLEATGATDAPATEGTETTSRTQDVVLTESPEQTPAIAEEKIVLPVSGETINAYSADSLAYNATTRDWRTHEGIDLAAAEGQEVLAAMDGTVYTVYEDESYGMTVVLRHADGYTTHYSNLSEEVAVKSGDKVTAGTVLGTVGQSAITETAQEPHLHFAVYLNNVPIDPQEFFAGT